MGLRPSKPQPVLHGVSLSEFQQAIDGIRAGLLQFGYFAAKAQLVPELEQWVFYDVDGEVLIRVPHELVARVNACFQAIRDAALDAHIEAMMKEPKTGW
jgi:hypothetical protein